MKIKIIAVGKLKEDFLRKGLAEYQKRLTRYCQIEIIQLPDQPIKEGINATATELIKAQEGVAILKHLNPSSYIIALEISGQLLSSEQLAAKIEKLGTEGRSHLTFIIGGFLGLGQDVLQQVDFKWSFSPLTFPHQLIRLILLEQIYRSFKIIKNEPYHK